MEAMDGVNAEVARIFAAKEERRKALARLPFPEKVRAVIELQKMAATILRARGKIVRPFNVSATNVNSPNASKISPTKS